MVQVSIQVVGVVDECTGDKKVNEQVKNRCGQMIGR